VIDESVEVLSLAAEERGPLSFEDRVCLVLARDNRWACVTNEKPLHRECERENVPSIWGLRLMIELVRAGQLTRETAMETARAIQAANPGYVTDEIMARFAVELM